MSGSGSSGGTRSVAPDDGQVRLPGPSSAGLLAGVNHRPRLGPAVIRPIPECGRPATDSRSIPPDRR